MAAASCEPADVPCCIDLGWQGQANVIGSWQVGPVVVDPGPSSCLPALLDQLDAEPELFLLTHIHLDHAGAAGALARRFPGARFLVHRAVATHLADPTRLRASAARVYGARMDELWGALEAVPADRIDVADGGERVVGFDVVATPGHAEHHLTFVHSASGTAFAGDVAGVRAPAGSEVFPPTPPPQIDVDAWLESIGELRARRPERLALAHFGSHEDVEGHLASLERRLERWSLLSQKLDASAFERCVRDEVRESSEPAAAKAIELGLGPEACWHGLTRYWAKRAESGAATVRAEGDA